VRLEGCAVGRRLRREDKGLGLAAVARVALADGGSARQRVSIGVVRSEAAGLGVWRALEGTEGGGVLAIRSFVVSASSARCIQLNTHPTYLR
jgi:hypothetical protein